MLIGQLVQSRGEVSVRTAKFKSWEKMKAGSNLRESSTVHVGSDSEAVLKVNEMQVQVSENTLIQFYKPEQIDELQVDYGRLSLSANQKKSIGLNFGGARVQVEVNSGSLRIERAKGTNQAVIVSQRGSVSVVNEDGSSRTLPAGQRFEIELPNQARIPADEETHLNTISSEPEPPATPQQVGPKISSQPLVNGNSQKANNLLAPDVPVANKAMEKQPEPMPTPTLPTTTPKNENSVEKQEKVEPFSNQVEVGLGFNYIDFSQSSTFTRQRVSGISGPSYFFLYEHKWDMWSLRAQSLRVNSKTKSTEGNNIEKVHDTPVEADSLSLGTPGLLFFDQLEIGLNRSQMPFIFENSGGLFRGATDVVSATMGGRKKWNLSPSSYVTWEQRVLIPLSSSRVRGDGQYSSRLGIEGSLGWYRCLGSGFSYGASWFGQANQGVVELDATNTYSKDSLSSLYINTNFQLRLNYGQCAPFP